MDKKTDRKQKSAQPPANATSEQPAVAKSGPPKLLRREVILTLAGLMLAQFLASLDQTIVGTALPKIITDLGGFSKYTWVVTAYMITSTVTIPIVAKMSDMYGRKWFLVGGIIIFLIGSAICGTSQTMDQLIAYRAIQGIGGGAIMALAFTILGDLFPPSERGKYAGIMAGVFGLSAIVGPMLGGYITDHFSWHNFYWRGVFYVNIPIGIIIILLIIFFFPHLKFSTRKHKIDFLGIIALALTVVPLLMALSLGGVNYAWTSPQIIGLFEFSAVMLFALLNIEKHVKEPIIPLWIFKDRVVSVASLAIFLTGFGMFAGIVFVPLFFQGILGKSATSSGSYLTPLMLGMITGSLLSGQYLSRMGGHYRTQGLVGCAIMAGGLFLLSMMTAHTPESAAVVNLIITGFGLGVTMPVYTIAVQNAVPYSVMGIATSTTAFFRSIGGVLGMAVVGSVLNNRFAADFTANLSPQLKAVIPSDQLNQLVSNPQVLFSSGALDKLQAQFAGFGSQGADMLNSLLTTLKNALCSGLSEGFLICFCVIIAAFVVNFFLKEIPLRTHH
jgi:EmrB/QacA subfamily drug resistance transporter